MKTTVTDAASAVLIQNSSNARQSTADWTARAFLIRNVTGTADIYLETDSAATEANGFPWLSDDSPIEIVLEAGQKLNAIVESGGGSQEIRILRSGR